MTDDSSRPASTAPSTQLDREQLREEFIGLRGFWSEPLEQLLELDAAFFKAFLNLSAVPWRSGVLEPKVRELIYVAVNGAATSLYEPALRIHVRRAIELGASDSELLEVLELTSTLGIHACTIGVPLLFESAGRVPSTDLDPHRQALKEDFESKRGYWHPFWNGLLELDPDFFEAYVEFSAHPWTNGVLEPKTKELIYIAFDASATHLFVPGLKLHIDSALALGATVDEVVEVLELASVIGIHTCILGVPILLDELARARASTSSPLDRPGELQRAQMEPSTDGGNRH